MKATDWKVRTHRAPLFPARLGFDLRPDGVFPRPDGVAIEVNEVDAPRGRNARGMVLLLEPAEARELARNLTARAALVEGQRGAPRSAPRESQPVFCALDPTDAPCEPGRYVSAAGTGARSPTGKCEPGTCGFTSAHRAASEPGSAR